MRYLISIVLVLALCATFGTGCFLLSKTTRTKATIPVDDGTADCKGDFLEEGIPPCDSDGACIAKNGKCIAGSDADCRQSHLCEPPETDRCTARNGQCWVAAQTDAACKATDACDRYGHCTARDGVCIAGSDADCKEVEWCFSGQCTARNGECVGE